MSRLTVLVPRPFGFVHLAWAILILAGCVALAMIGGGHPPPIILVPPLLVAGFLGHLLLLLIAWLLGRGRERVAAAPVATRRWVVELILIAIVLGALSIGSITITVAEIGELRHQPQYWLLLAAAAVVHTTAFVLLLLRIGAARHLIATVASGWGLAMLLQLREARSPGELALGIALIVALLAIALYVLRAGRIRSALG